MVPIRLPPSPPPIVMLIVVEAGETLGDEAVDATESLGRLQTELAQGALRKQRRKKCRDCLFRAAVRIADEKIERAEQGAGE